MRTETLEYQADRIEAVLAAHKAPARIMRGSVGPRVYRFELTPAPRVRISAICALADDLAVALRVQSVRITHGRDGVALEIENPDPKHINLLDMIKHESLPAHTAILGISSEGDPVSMRLSSPTTVTKSGIVLSTIQNMVSEGQWRAVREIVERQ